MASVPTKYCKECGGALDARAEVCPQCGARPAALDTPTAADVRQVSGTKVAAGICAILLGSLGIHKFILGLTTPGIIMLLVSVLTCGIGAFPMSVIGLVEGIIYLTKTDEDFYQTYIVEKKAWF